MTEPKHIAQSLMTLLINPATVEILDLASDIEPVTAMSLGMWNYDLMQRKPGPAHDDFGIFKGTDLDLATFLFALSGRGAVINIPTYKAMRQVRVREGQQLTSKYNRHGEVIAVQSNQDFFSFSLKMIDQNVIGEDKVGDFRTFSLTDFDGDWYDGWKTIEFSPTLKENRFITENKLWTGHKIIFKNFIHPNRWTSFFGHHYVIAKILIDRLTEEASHLGVEVNKMIEAGIKFPSGKGPKAYEYPVKGETKSMSFPKFEAKVFIPENQFSGKFTTYKPNTINLVGAYNKKKRLLKAKKLLQFNTRAAEYAHFKRQDLLPAWIKNEDWEPGFRIPGGRIEWMRLKLFQPEVGQHSIAILKRTTTKATQVNIDY